jgi:threonine dehydrogenase-like Zn-dependent dehydrogenase
VVAEHHNHDPAGRHRHDTMLFKTVQAGKIDPKLLITHRFNFDGILDAYDTFGRAASTRALKVIIAT